MASSSVRRVLATAAEAPIGDSMSLRDYNWAHPALCNTCQNHIMVDIELCEAYNAVMTAEIASKCSAKQQAICNAVTRGHTLAGLRQTRQLRCSVYGIKAPCRARLAAGALLRQDSSPAAGATPWRRRHAADPGLEGQHPKAICNNISLCRCIDDRECAKPARQAKLTALCSHKERISDTAGRAATHGRACRSQWVPNNFWRVSRGRCGEGKRVFVRAHGANVLSAR